MPHTKLSELTYADLKRFPVWAATGNYAEDEDAQLEAVQLNADDQVPSTLEEVWCLCSACFADGSEYLATAMCRGDSDDVPALWSIWNGEADVPLLLPPAPSFVLEKKGPAFFASKFGKGINEVFPLTIRAVSRFETPPEERSIRLAVSGVF